MLNLPVPQCREEEPVSFFKLGGFMCTGLLGVDAPKRLLVFCRLCLDFDVRLLTQIDRAAPIKYSPLVSLFPSRSRIP